MKNVFLRALAAAIPTLGLIDACAVDRPSVAVIGDACDGPCAPSFVETEDGGGDASAVPESSNLCIGTSCPWPYATCAGKLGVCTTNLKTDLENCGACGAECHFGDAGEFSYNGLLFCDDGKCGVICDTLSSDCNHVIEDGCETYVEADPNNCGACGKTCAPGEVCWRGACGCPPGYPQCGDTCAKLDDDPSNCGVCGKTCDLPDLDAGPGAWPCQPGVLPSLFGPTCSHSSCAMGCLGSSGDCNHDLCGDGCETDLGTDPNNCGTCGHTCGPDQGCINGKCECEHPELSFCSECVDVLKDPDNCGACGNRCPGQQDYFNKHTGRPICVLGRCTYYCPPGHADCDHRIDNGCETDLMVDPLNCGSCGAHCDLDGGQPCAAGRCLTKPCEGEDGGVH